MELRGFARKVADFFQHRLLLHRWQYSHTGCRKKEERRIRDVFERYVFEGMAKELVEVLGPDIVRVLAKCGYARMYLLGPLLIRLDVG